jgi:hypothetical protein
MTTGEEDTRLKRRLMIVGILALVGVGLSVTDRLVGAGMNILVNDFASAHATDAQINPAIDAVLGHYSIEPKSVTTWRVITPDKKFLRLEQRIVVPYDFASVQCNHELSQQLFPFGARVAATERSREKVVTMHIISHGVIIRTISFAMRSREPDERVEHVKAIVKRKAH